MEKIKIKISGMSCIGCARGIEGSFKNLNGILGVKVDFENKLMSLEFDLEIITLNQILDYLKKIGYEGEVEE